MIFILLTSLLFATCQSDRKHSDDSGTHDFSTKIAVLTFDDAVKSHHSFVAPLLKDLGFNATFFITYEWMDDTVNFMSWQEVAELHSMGFEIGNHSWHHWDFSQPKTAAMMEGELGLVNWMLMQVGVPKPVSFAWNGNGFGPEAVEVLEKEGFQFARRGKQPEVPYGELEAGPGYIPGKHHPLLIPTTCDAYPDMDIEHFAEVLESVGENDITILQFHGVPDNAHPWVNTSQEQFKEYMKYLEKNNYHVIAMKDLDKYLPDEVPDDPMLNYRYTLKGDDALDWPVEVLATRENLEFWLRNMKCDHRFTNEEMMQATGLSSRALEEALSALEAEMQPEIQSEERKEMKSNEQQEINSEQRGKIRLEEEEDIRSEVQQEVKSETGQEISPDMPENGNTQMVKVRPYPGVRHPRINFKEGMLSPMRGTKVSIFLPWDPDDYVVLDLPEALFSQFGLTFLGHKHIPTLFDYHKIVIENTDWSILDGGSFHNIWDLPNNMRIGADIYPGINELDLKLWLQNNTDTVLTDLQSQVCIMLKMATEFNALNNDNKIFDSPIAAVKSVDGQHWILTAWNGGNHAWGNENCPCLHSDPRLPVCLPGETVSVKGKIWFYNGTDIKDKIESIKKQFSAYK